MEKPQGPTTAQPLRVGLLLDSLAQPRWVRRIIEEISNSSIAKVVLIIKNDCEPQSTKLIDRFLRSHDQFLYGLYTKLDNRLSRVSSDAFELVNISDLCANVALIGVVPIMKKFSDWLEDIDIEKINEYRLDVALRFGFRILRGRALQIAQYGVWSYHHGDSFLYRGGPPGFWEVMRDDPVTGSMLQRLTEELDNGNVLYRSWAPTLHRFSVKKNNNNYYWKSASFIGRKLAELHRDGKTRLADEGLESVPRPYNGRLYKVPKNREMAGLLWKLGKRAAKRTTEKIAYSETWSLAYHFKRNRDANEALHQFINIVPPKGHFWADPFPVKVEGKYWVFFEDFCYTEGKATIAALELHKDLSIGEPVTVLQRDYHLSYPFLFEWQDALYMIPESGSNNTVELYRCKSFPLQWERQTVLIEANNPSDATLVQFEGKWWMFVNIQEEGVTVNWEELHLYHSDSPLGPWLPHRRNPVRSDVRNSRPAGRFFYHNGQLMRPAQDCSTRYGYATAINRIIKLTTDEFQEIEVARIVPNWNKNVIGTHTLNTVDELTVIDWLLRRPRLLPR